MRVPYRNMTLDELAVHIGMDAREVRRLAERGVLPGHQVGGAWRFNSAQLLDWLQRELHALGDEHIRNLEKAMSDVGDDGPIVAPLLSLAGIELNLAAKSRASVLRELTAVAVRTGLVYDAAAIVTGLEEREALAPTALAGGVALPHPRRLLPYATAEPLVCIARVAAGVPYGAPDGRLTDLFALVCSHDERGHLSVLARLARLFSTEFPQQVRACESAAEVLELVIAAERHLPQP